MNLVIKDDEKQLSKFSTCESFVQVPSPKECLF